MIASRFSCFLALLLALAASRADAQAVRTEGSTVFVNEVPCVVLKSANGGLSPAKRAVVLAGNLEKVGTQGIWVKKSKKTYVLISGESPLLYVTPLEARANKTSAASLAQQWARRLTAAGELPGIKLDKAAFRLPPGETRSAAMVGSQVREVVVSVDQPQVAVAERKNGRIVIQTIRPGTATVTLNGSTATETIQVVVQPYAASLPQTLEATVSGPVVDSETIRDVIYGAVRTKLATQPSSSVRFNIPKIEQPLTAMTSRIYRVHLHANAPGTFEAQGYADVVVRNVALDFIRETELWYCNHPENVTAPGNLFGGRLVRSAPVRMLYHHINESRQTLAIQVLVVNDSDSPARVMVIPGDADPVKNPVKAGYDAGDQFMKGWIRNSGEVLTVPARTTLPISLRQLRPKDTMSGLCYLRLIEGGPESVLVRTDALSQYAADSHTQRAMKSSTPWRETGLRAASVNEQRLAGLSDHVYPKPFRDPEPLNFSVLDQVRVVTVGERPLTSSTGLKLDGNFGVIYTIQANLANPTDLPVRIEIVFEASAGYTGGLFMMDNRYLRTPLLQPKGNFELEKITLAPGQKRTVTIRTIPLSGASYPIRIWVAQAGYKASLVGG